MKIIVGLGNPGEEHQNNRHDLGFMVVDELIKVLSSEYPPAARLPAGQGRAGQVASDKKFDAEIYKIAGNLLVKPQTFMNNSGKAIKKILNFYKIKDLKNLIVIHDDLDLELGRIKIEVKGGVSGHHGIESIINEIGSKDFVKVRIGIGRPAKRDDDQSCYYDITKNYLLSDFPKDEKERVQRVIREAAVRVLGKVGEMGE